MRRIAPLVLALVLGMALAQGLGGRTITVGTDPTWPPFESVDDHDQIVGFDVDLMNAICSVANCVAEFKSAHFDGLIPAVNAGAFDVIASGMTITAEREKQVDFSSPYKRTDQAVAVRAEDENLTLEDFTDQGSKLLLGSQSGTTNANLGRTLVGPDRVKLFDSFDQATQALLDGDVDGVILDQVVAEAFARRYGSKLVIGIRAVGSGDAIGLAVAEGDPRGLLDALDAGIRTLQGNGTIAELEAKWF